MSQWSKSAYVGPTQEGWEEGRGKFTYPNGVTYDGQFKKGELADQPIQNRWVNWDYLMCASEQKLLKISQELMRIQKML